MRVRANQNGFSAIEAIALVAVALAIGFAGWRLYNSRNGAKNEAAPVQMQAKGNLHQDQSLDVQFRNPMGGNPVRVEGNHPDQIKSGTIYTFSFPGYGDGAAVSVGSKDLKYTAGSLFSDISLFYFGDVTLDLPDAKAEVNSAIALCQEAGVPQLGCTRIIADTKDRLSYVTFDNNVAYLTTLKYLPSDKRLPTVAFGYRVDMGLMYDEKDTAESPLSDLIEADDLEFFNTVSDSLGAYRR